MRDCVLELDPEELVVDDAALVEVDEVLVALDELDRLGTDDVVVAPSAELVVVDGEAFDDELVAAPSAEVVATASAAASWPAERWVAVRPTRLDAPTTVTAARPDRALRRAGEIVRDVRVFASMHAIVRGEPENRVRVG